MNEIRLLSSAKGARSSSLHVISHQSKTANTIEELLDVPSHRWQLPSVFIASIRQSRGSQLNLRKRGNGRIRQIWQIRPDQSTASQKIFWMRICLSFSCSFALLHAVRERLCCANNDRSFCHQLPTSHLPPFRAEGQFVNVDLVTKGRRAACTTC